jgi:hypothetical protein
LLFVKRTSSISSLIEAAGLVVRGNAVAGLLRRVITDKIMIERTIYGSPHMTGDAHSGDHHPVRKKAHLHQCNFLAGTPLQG